MKQKTKKPKVTLIIIPFSGVLPKKKIKEIIKSIREETGYALDCIIMERKEYEKRIGKYTTSK